MNILMLAPHPFYQARGTPIAVELVLRALSERGDQVDVVTYPEGSDIYLKNIKLYRTQYLPFIKDIRPGFSWKKIVYDFLILIKAIQLLRKKRYDIIHAGEEAAFIGLLFSKIYGIPYIYDMDSSLAQQMIEKHVWLRPLAPCLNFFERMLVKNAEAVIVVCDALAEDIQSYSPRRVVVIPDISLLNYSR